MNDRFTVRHQVEFSETDMAGIVHFSNYFKWMESAESAFFQSIGQPLIESVEDRFRGWPRVRAQCDFKAPIHFQETVEIHLFVRALKIKAIQYAFYFYKIEDNVPTILLAKGEMTTLCAERSVDSPAMKSVTIPEPLLQTITEAPESEIRSLLRPAG